MESRLCAQSLGHVWLFATAWFSQQEYWSGLPFPLPGDLPGPGMEPTSPSLAGGFFTRWATQEAQVTWATTSPLTYRERTEGCKGLIRVTSTEQGTTHTAEGLRIPGPWMGMKCCFPWWGNFPHTAPCKPDWPAQFQLGPRTLAENLIWPDMWLVPKLSQECAMLGRASVTQTVRCEHSKTSCARRDKVSDKPLTDRSKPKLWEQRAAKGPSGLAWNVQTCWKLTRSPPPEAQSGPCITQHPFIPHAKKLKQPQKPFGEAVKWHLIKNTLAAVLLRWKVSHVKRVFFLLQL